jgi:NADH-quinone oxidoreductase subunit E
MKIESKLSLSNESIKELKRLKDLYPVRKSSVLMVLHVIFDQYGYINSDAVREAADLMEIPVIDFEQAASFYTMFPGKPVGKYHIQVCRTLSCELRGSEELRAYLMEKLGIGIGGVSGDGLFSLVEVECLGSCGTAPMMQVNDKYYENLNSAKVDKILDDLRNRTEDG